MEGLIEHMSDYRPLVTFAVVSYNQERYIAEALESALAQTYTPLEVLISDDCSTDATFAVIEKIISNYTGPHKVIVSRNERNLGLIQHENKVWELSSGDLLVFQAGDDISLPHRTSKLVETWLSRDPHPDLVYSGTVRIDEHGNVILVDNKVIETTPRIDDTITGRKVFIAGGCALAVSRSLHFFVGPMNENVIAEDFVYSFRALLGNGFIGIPEPLVLYRQHSASIVGQLRSARKLGRLDDSYTKSQLATLHEYKRSMKAYKVKRPYLHWILDRRIKTCEMELRFGNAGTANKLLLLLWAICSLRLRAARNMLDVLKSRSATT